MSGDDVTRRPVLVLDADGQAGLCIVRSLGRRGIPVTAGSERRWSLGALSKYAADRTSYPSPTAEPAAFVDALVDRLETGDFFAVLPVTDGTTAVVSRHREELAATGTVVGAAPWAQFRTTYDKAETFALAASLDVPTPTTHAPESLSDVEALAPDLTYPVVVKPRSKHVWDDGERLVQHRVGADDYAETPADLLAAYGRSLEAPGMRSHPPLVQEYVEGRTVTTVGVARDGDLLTRFQELRLRTTPAAGGNSTLLRGFESETMARYAEAVLDALEWTGPVQVEFMWTDDDEFYLIEVNGRYWGSTPLAVASGVDVPWHHYCLLTGHLQRRPPAYRTDVVQQRLLYGDLKWLGEQLGAGRVSALVPFCRALVSAQQVFLSGRDPLPTAGAVAEALQIAAERLGFREGEGRLAANN
jgi:predicted ATP-grasp superfamily ATP-dependent carboligase